MRWLALKADCPVLEFSLQEAAGTRSVHAEGLFGDGKGFIPAGVVNEEEERQKRQKAMLEANYFDMLYLDEEEVLRRCLKSWLRA